MKPIIEHLNNILQEISKINNELLDMKPDEFVALSDIEQATYQARKIFERRVEAGNSKEI